MLIARIILKYIPLTSLLKLRNLKKAERAHLLVRILLFKKTETEESKKKLINLLSLLSTITQSENEIDDGYQEPTRKPTTKYTPRPLLAAPNIISRPQNGFGIRPDISGRDGHCFCKRWCRLESKNRTIDKQLRSFREMKKTERFKIFKKLEKKISFFE